MIISRPLIHLDAHVLLVQYRSWMVVQP